MDIEISLNDLLPNLVQGLSLDFRIRSMHVHWQSCRVAPRKRIMFELLQLHVGSTQRSRRRRAVAAPPTTAERLHLAYWDGAFAISKFAQV